METETTIGQAPQPLEGTMSLDELKQRRLFLDLTARQQLLIENFILSGGDKIFAVKSAYDVTSDESARVMTYTRFADATVIEVLNLFFGRTPREVLQMEADRLCRKKNPTIAEVSALRLKCELAGVTPSNLPRVNGYTPIAEREPKYHIGQVVTLNGKKIRITKLNADGRPTEGDPVED